MPKTDSLLPAWWLQSSPPRAGPCYLGGRLPGELANRFESWSIRGLAIGGIDVDLDAPPAFAGTRTR